MVNKVKLGELLTTLTDYHANGAYKKLKENVELLDEPNFAVMIRTTNFEQEDFTTNLKYISEHAYEFLAKSKVRPNDIIMNKIANAGSSYLMPDLGVPVSLAMNLFLLRVDPSKANPIYIYLYLKINEAYVKSFANGSVTKTITKDAVRNLEIDLPDRATQDFLVEQFTCLNNKITLNRQINQTLEQMAQTLFKSWFVDFDPVIDNALDADTPIPDELQHRAEARKAVRESEGFNPLPDDVRQLFPDAFEESELGWVPKGWEIKCLRDLSEKISKGTTPRRSDLESAIEDTKTALFVKVKDMTDDSRVNLDSLDSIPKSVSTGVLKRSVLCEGDILLSIAGTIGRVASVERELDGSNCNQAVAFLRPKDRLAHHLFIKQTLLSTRVRHYINSKVVQAVQANFSLTHFGEIQTVMPSEQVIKQFNLLANTYSSRSLSTFRQNDTLTKLRDTLLPKLISGELRLDEVELAVE
ncbi:restriction endonuclease subunit S [Vibrio mimicus]